MKPTIRLRFLAGVYSATRLVRLARILPIPSPVMTRIMIICVVFVVMPVRAMLMPMAINDNNIIARRPMTSVYGAINAAPRVMPMRPALKMMPST